MTASQASSLAESLLQELRTAGLSLGTVESCTGGLIASAITAVPGASDIFMGSFITYANRIKESFADVPATILAQYGAVSEETARAMAKGGQKNLAVDVCLSVTGIAGPGGGTPEKPVGLVHIAAIGPNGLIHRRYVFNGTRDAIREASVLAALQMIRDVI